MRTTGNRSNRESWWKTCAWAALAGLMAGPLLASDLPNVTSHEDTDPSTSDAILEGNALSGLVTGTGGKPVADAAVLALPIQPEPDVQLARVASDDLGRYLFEQLPVGLYEIIVFKSGFLPQHKKLERRQDDRPQALDFQLDMAPTEDTAASNRIDDYLQARRRLRSDVLREVEVVELDNRVTVESPSGRDGRELDLVVGADEGFHTRLSAITGMEQTSASGSAQVSVAEVGFATSIGKTNLGIEATRQQLSADSSLPDGNGEATSFVIHSRNQAGSVTLSKSRNELMAEDGPVEYDQTRVQYKGRAGGLGLLSISAALTEESGFHNGGVSPLFIPSASRETEFAGSIERKLGSSTGLQAGMLIRQREAIGPVTFAPMEQFDLFGVADTQINKKVVVEYGIFSGVHDGELSLMIHGGTLVHLAPQWQAELSVSHSLDSPKELETDLPRFSSALFDSRTTCQQSGYACYEVALTQARGRDRSTRIGAVHKTYAETLRLYFNRNFFDRLESVFLVRGDEIPELQFEMVRRLSPKVLARLESNIASGGGGIFYATDEQAYENQVRYLVTSLDTQFQQTSTGIFFAFHHLEQDLLPLDSEGQAETALEVQRLQLMLTQDLKILADLASKWAVQLNMEVSRGATPYHVNSDSDELYKKLVGGFSVSF